jgi:hypothetical protein
MTDQNNTTPEETPVVPAAESHEETMAREFFEADSSTLPAQFGGDVDKFMASWKEQRAALTRTQQELSELKGTTAPPAEAEAPSVDAPEVAVPDLVIPEAPVAPEVDDIWVTAGAELRAGTLSETTRVQLLSNGVPGEVIDAFVSGQQAKASNAARAAADLVGGPQTLQSIIDWSQSALSDAERATVNSALNGEGWQTTVLGLKARMDSANPTSREAGRGPELVNATPATRAIKPYASSAEMTNAIGATQYGIDAEYTAFVQERIRVSNFGL